MQREQAIEIIKQIMDACSFKSIVLNLHQGNLPNVFQIQVELNNENGQSIAEKIAKENSLAVKKTGNLLIIYKPQNH